MGQPAVPDTTTRAQARDLARLVLRAIEDDESVIRAIVRYLQLRGFQPTPEMPLIDQAFWMLASTLLYPEDGNG